MYACMYVCMYVHIYIYINEYIHLCIYIIIHALKDCDHVLVHTTVLTLYGGTLDIYIYI